MRKLVLHDFHVECGANFTDERGWRMPVDYGDVNSELHAVKNKVALIDRSCLGKVKLNGSDSLDLINRISTNDMTKLLMGIVCDTIFSTPNGRIVDYCRVLRLDTENIIISSHTDCAHIIDWINRFIILEDVEVSDVSKEFVWLTLLGPESTQFIRSISGQEVFTRDEQVWIEKDGYNFPAVAHFTGL